MFDRTLKKSLDLLFLTSTPYIPICKYTHFSLIWQYKQFYQILYENLPKVGQIKITTKRIKERYSIQSTETKPFPGKDTITTYICSPLPVLKVEQKSTIYSESIAKCGLNLRRGFSGPNQTQYVSLIFVIISYTFNQFARKSSSPIRMYYFFDFSVYRKLERGSAWIGPIEPPTLVLALILLTFSGAICYCSTQVNMAMW